MGRYHSDSAILHDSYNCGNDLHHSETRGWRMGVDGGEYQGSEACGTIARYSRSRWYSDRFLCAPSPIVFRIQNLYAIEQKDWYWLPLPNWPHVSSNPPPPPTQYLKAIANY